MGHADGGSATRHGGWEGRGEDLVSHGEGQGEASLELPHLFSGQWHAKGLDVSSTKCGM